MTDAKTSGAKTPQNDFIWADLIHLGYRMWSDNPMLTREEAAKLNGHVEGYAFDHVPTEDEFFRELARAAVDAGANTLVIDVGEAVRYDSAPELAIDGTWSKEKLQTELNYLREIGLEPIPKLNFSACHDLWLGEYARQLSTPRYYRVCTDVIAELCELFDKPRFFHLGFDEEDYWHQTGYDFISYRQGELWWNDFLFCVKEVEKRDVRAWIWSDQCWRFRDDFLKRTPRSVLQSNWFYCEQGATFDDLSNDWLKTFIDLDEAGFEQVPASSTWAKKDAFPGLVEFCEKNIGGDKLKGYMQTVWKPTAARWRADHLEALDYLARGKKIRENR